MRVKCCWWSSLKKWNSGRASINSGTAPALIYFLASSSMLVECSHLLIKSIAFYGLRMQQGLSEDYMHSKSFRVSNHPSYPKRVCFHSTGISASESNMWKSEMTVNDPDINSPDLIMIMRLMPLLHFFPWSSWIAFWSFPCWWSTLLLYTLMRNQPRKRWWISCAKATMIQAWNLSTSTIRASIISPVIMCDKCHFFTPYSSIASSALISCYNKAFPWNMTRANDTLTKPWPCGSADPPAH